MILKIIKPKTYIGIDPGWKNLGFAVINEDVLTGKLTRVTSQVLNPSEYENISAFIIALDLIINGLDIYKVDKVTIERFISYKGVDSAEFEIINRLIGALTFYFSSDLYWQVEPTLFRAVDWKMALVKALHVKKGFENPSLKLDKKFSIAAAKACLDGNSDFKTDHEADAICLAVIDIYLKMDKGT